MPETMKRSASTVVDDATSTKKQLTSLDSIRSSSTLIVADTADFEQLASLNAHDGTTNPSLILQASQIETYKPIISKAIEAAKSTGKNGDELVEEACDRCAVAFGEEILKIVPGVVSTEVDACLSYDADASYNKALKIIKLYEELGITKDRVLIKMASTWEGCQAAKKLEAEGIRTNMTLLFSFAQACIAAEANAYLISPFVGRILDFFKSKNPSGDFTGMNDPGVKSVTEIYNYYKKFGYNTVVMGASFRSTDEIKCLSGCDRVTVSPKLLQELNAEEKAVEKMLDAEKAKDACQLTEKLVLSEAQFRWMLNEDEMATVKLSEGIRNFNADYKKLQKFVKEQL